MSDIKARIRVISVKGVHSRYDVKIQYEFKMTINPGAKNEKHSLVVNGTSINSWASKGGKLLLAEVKALTVTQKMDAQEGAVYAH